MDAATLSAEMRSTLEYAPANPGPVAPTLRGWILPASDGLLYVCARCAGRIIARSSFLPRNAEPVWKDKAEPFGVCLGCEACSLPTPTAQGSKS